MTGHSNTSTSSKNCRPLQPAPGSLAISEQPVGVVDVLFSLTDLNGCTDEPVTRPP